MFSSVAKNVAIDSADFSPSPSISLSSSAVAFASLSIELYFDASNCAAYFPT